MLGAKQNNDPITDEYLNIIKEDYREAYGEDLDTVIKVKPQTI